MPSARVIAYQLMPPYPPRACVVLQPGARATAQELLAFCDGRIARYKLPRSVEFLDTLPRNAMGKVLRRTLRERYWQGHAVRVRYLVAKPMVRPSSCTQQEHLRQATSNAGGDAGAFPQSRVTISDAFWPPKPKAFTCNVQ